MFSHSLFMLILPALLVQAAPAASGSTAGLYDQCGGINWTGATDCASGAYCKSQNEYYYQCVATGADVASVGSSVTTTLGAQVTSSAIASSSSIEATFTLATEVTSSSSSVEVSSSAVTSSSSSSAATSSSDSASAVAASASASGSADDLKVISGGFSGTADTTRYWDCCLPSYSWSGKSSAVSNPVSACDASGNKLSGQSFQSGCNGGEAYMCNDQQPWVVNDNLAYGFIAASISGGTDQTLACACVKMTFTDTAIKDKIFVAQITNTGSDLSGNHFDIAMPASGFGIFTTGCTNEFGSGYSWGEQYGGVSSESDCANIPKAIQSGCEFRFDWFEGADNPSASFEQVVCPSAITDISGCVRNDE